MKTKFRAATYLALLFLIVTGRFLLESTSRYSTLSSHTLMEFVAAILALFVGTLALVRFYTKKNNSFLFIGTGFLGAGLLDGYHAIIVGTFFEDFFPLFTLPQIPWSWNASPTFLSLLIVGSWLAWRREASMGMVERGVYAVVGLVFLASTLYFALIPLPSAPTSEYLLGRVEAGTSATFFLLALVGYLAKGHWRFDSFESWLVRALIIACSSQAIFMFFSTSLFDTMFTVATVLKQASYLCVLIGLLISMHAIFKQAEGSATELSVTNEALRREIAERKEAEQMAHEQGQFAEALRQAGNALSATLDFDTLLGVLLEQVGRVLPYDTANVILIERAKDVALGVREYGRSADGARVKFPPASIASLQQVADTRTPLIIPDTAVHPQWENGLATPNIRSWAGAPVIVQGQVVALLTLGNKKPHFYRPENAAGLTAFANQAAIAIENAQLFQQAQREITERKRAEIALEEERALLAQRVEERTAELSAANAELARASRLKDEFLASMSHELRTPLNAILGMAEALQDGVYGAMNENQLGSLHSMEESGRHLLALINDILDVSKIEAGRLELEVRPVSVRSVCQASLRFVKQDAHKKGLQVTVSYDQSVETVRADERRLKQILVNLLSNAVKFTPAGGQIGLEVRGDVEAQVVDFTVWDTGIGIPAETMNRLFQPFVQLDSRLARAHNGTGLGLALVYRMTELHGGSVVLESEVGDGSRFTVSLPWQPDGAAAHQDGEGTEQPENTATSSHPLTPTPFHPLTVLVVEDNEATLKTVSDFLQLEGYEVKAARTGREALARAQEIRPDVIVMDIQMPEMSGLEATRRIRADAGLARTPIIALTALAMPGDRERCLAAGANLYLSKPVGLKGLVEAITAVNNGHE